MFVIQVQNALGETSKHYWMNQSGDDFLRYLPRNFGVQKEQIRAWMFSDDDFPILEGLLKALGDNTRYAIYLELARAATPLATAAVSEALGAVRRGRTTLIIAHRLSTIEHADRIVVMEGGRIAETGSHAELLTRQGSYAALFKLGALGSADKQEIGRAHV